MRQRESAAKRKQYLFVVEELVSREIKRKYSRSRLGILWSVLNPLLSMSVLSLVFSTMFRKSIEHYPVYYLTGFIIWNFFTTATNTAMTALVDNKLLLLQVRLPKAVFPISRVYAAFVNFLFSMIAYLIILAVFRIPVKSPVLFFPVIVALVFLFALGVSYMLSILYAFFGDIRHLYSVILTLWMYLSALFYPVELLPEIMQRAILFNPVYNFIAGARSCILYGEFPDAAACARMTAWGLGTYFIGWYIFKKSQNRIMQKL